MNNQIAVEAGFTDGFIGMRNERAVRNCQMMVVDEFLSLEIKLRYGEVIPSL